MSYAEPEVSAGNISGAGLHSREVGDQTVRDTAVQGGYATSVPVAQHSIGGTRATPLTSWPEAAGVGPGVDASAPGFTDVYGNIGRVGGVGVGVPQGLGVPAGTGFPGVRAGHLRGYVQSDGTPTSVLNVPLTGAYPWGGAHAVGEGMGGMTGVPTLVPKELKL